MEAVKIITMETLRKWFIFFYYRKNIQINSLTQTAIILGILYERPSATKLSHPSDEDGKKYSQAD